MLSFEPQALLAVFRVDGSFVLVDRLLRPEAYPWRPAVGLVETLVS